MKTCPNEKCPGPVIYQGTSCVNGAFIEWYECRGCWTLHKVEAQPAPLVLTTSQVTVGDAEHQRLWEIGTLIYREDDGREWTVDRISDRANGEYCLHGSEPIDWYKPCTFASLILDYTPPLAGDEDTEPLDPRDLAAVYRDMDRKIYQHIDAEDRGEYIEDYPDVTGAQS